MFSAVGTQIYYYLWKDAAGTVPVTPMTVASSVQTTVQTSITTSVASFGATQFTPSGSDMLMTEESAFKFGIVGYVYDADVTRFTAAIKAAWAVYLPSEFQVWNIQEIKAKDIQFWSQGYKCFSSLDNYHK